MKKTTALLLAAMIIGCTTVSQQSDLKVIKITGVCTDAATGDGMAEDGYINYSNVKGVQKDDVITTYFIYASGSSEIDDIEYRYDIINH